MSQLQPHPAAMLWPMLKEPDLQALADSIKERGLNNPITIYEEMILDGRNRYKACQMAGVEPRFTEFNGGDPFLFVFDQNGERRLDVTNAMKYGIWKRTVAMSDEWLTKQRRIVKEANAKRSSAQRGNENASKQRIKNSSSTCGTTTESDLSKDRNKTRAAAAEFAKVDKGTVAKMDALEKAAPDLYEKVVDGETPLTQAQRVAKERKREAKREENRQQVAQAAKPDAVEGVYSTIVIDPPWDWGDEGDQDQLGRSRPDYATMSIDELKALPVDKLAATDAHLYLWITNRSLPKGFALMDAWGFRYITAITWVKPSYGLGNYYRGQTEHLLFGVRGSLPLMRKDVGTVFNAARGKGGHSSKPDEAYQLIESCSPGPYIDMFSRNERDNWITWGQDAKAA